MSGLGAMMAGGGGQNKPDHEWYPTETPATITLLKAELGKILRLSGGTVREPCCGDGAISKVLKRAGLAVQSADLIDRGYGEAGVDFLKWSPPGRPPARMPAIITNPPFSLAKEFLFHALDHGSPYVAFYLKSTWFHAQDRREVWARQKPAMIYALTWRTDPLGLGAPTIETIWAVWRRRFVDDQRDAAPYRPLDRVMSLREIGGLA